MKGINVRPEDGQRIRFWFRMPTSGKKTFTGTYREGVGIMAESGHKLARWQRADDRGIGLLGWEPLAESNQ